MENKENAKLGWNWGAFMFPLQFALGTKAYLAFLTLVPLLNLVWFFVCGAQGAQWAYDSGFFTNVDEFNGAMKSWNKAGFITFVIMVIIFAIYLAIFMGLINLFTRTF